MKFYFEEQNRLIPQYVHHYYISNYFWKPTGILRIIENIGTYNKLSREDNEIKGNLVEISQTFGASNKPIKSVTSSYTRPLSPSSQTSIFFAFNFFYILETLKIF